MFLRNYWYGLAWGREIKRAPFELCAANPLRCIAKPAETSAPSRIVALIACFRFPRDFWKETDWSGSITG